VAGEIGANGWTTDGWPKGRRKSIMPPILLAQA